MYIYFWNLKSSSSVSVYFWKLESASRGVYPFLKARIKSNNLPFWSVYLFWNLNWQRYQLQRPAGQRLVTNTTFRPLKFESWRIILSLKDFTWIWTLAAAPPHPKDCLAIYSFYSLRPHLKNALCHQKVKHSPESIISSIFINFVSLIPVTFYLCCWQLPFQPTENKNPKSIKLPKVESILATARKKFT